MSLGRTRLRESRPKVTSSSKAQAGRTSWEELSGKLAKTPRAGIAGRMWGCIRAAWRPGITEASQLERVSSRCQRNPIHWETWEVKAPNEKMAPHFLELREIPGDDFVCFWGKERMVGWFLVHKTGIQQGNLHCWQSVCYSYLHSSHLFDFLTLSSSFCPSSLTTTSR